MAQIANRWAEIDDATLRWPACWGHFTKITYVLSEFNLASRRGALRLITGTVKYFLPELAV
jgi:hypothetical protein